MNKNSEFRNRIKVDVDSPDFLEQLLYRKDLKENEKSKQEKQEKKFFSGAFESEDVLLEQEDDGLIK